MRKEYRKAVKERFSLGMRQVLPSFQPIKLKSQLLFGGEALFLWEAAECLHCFVLLVPDSKGRQSFTVELAWSALGRFPEGSARPTLILGPGDPDPVDVEEGIARLGDLAYRSDLWWHLPDPALERPGDLRALQMSLDPIESPTALAHAEGPVNEALDVLVRSGVPFLEKWVAACPGGSLSERGAT